MEYRGSYEQANTCQSYWQGNPYSDFYNKNPRNGPDFSWMSNDVRNPPYQPTYQQPYQSIYHPPFQPTYQEPYQPTFQPTYQEPYQFPCQYSDPRMPTFRQPLPYNPPQPNNDLAELKAILQQSIIIEQQTQAALKTQEEELNRFMLHQKYQETLFAQITASSSLWQPETLPPQEHQSYEIFDSITLRSGTDYNILTMPKDDEFEVPSKGFEVEIVDEVESEDETEILVENIFTRPSNTSIDRLNAPASIDTNTRSSIFPTDRVNSPELPNAEILNVNATTKELEEPTRGLSEKVSELVHIKTIEVRASELQYEPIEDQEELKPTMPEVAEEKVRPERDGTRRGTKRCWDPGGLFDKVRISPWARQRDSGNRFGGANGRGTQDNYDDPGDEQVTMCFGHGGNGRAGPL